MQNTETTQESTANETKKSFLTVLKSIKQKVLNGELDAEQATQIKRQMGFSKSRFTKSQTTKAKRKAKRKTQLNSRRVNRSTK